MDWLDACASSGWSDEHDGPVEVRTVGMLVHEDKKYICVASTVEAERKLTNARMTIPKSWIMQTRSIKL